MTTADEDLDHLPDENLLSPVRTAGIPADRLKDAGQVEQRVSRRPSLPYLTGVAARVLSYCDH